MAWVKEAKEGRAKDDSEPFAETGETAGRRALLGRMRSEVMGGLKRKVAGRLVFLG